MIIETADGFTVHLDESHWEQHIVARHPEMGGHREKVIETLQSPQGVFRSKRDTGTRIYVKTFTGISISGIVFANLALLVYVREAGGFLVTAHFSGAMLRSLGQQIWPS